jgi:hypothetical protein
VTLTLNNKIEASEWLGYGDPTDVLNLCDEEMAKYPQIECPVTHRFTPGLYIREIHMPANSIITSLLHLTTHPYVVTKGEFSVWYHDKPTQRIRAPYTGVTNAGTRRLLFIHEDTDWMTFHVTDKTDPDDIMEEITSNDFNPLIDKTNPLVNNWRQNKIQLEDTKC